MEIVFPDFYVERAKRRYDDENIRTLTSKEQKKIEKECELFLSKSNIFELENQPSLQNPDHFLLFKETHINYLLNSQKSLSSTYQMYDSSKPWICYWTSHALSLLDALPSNLEDMLDVLASCYNSDGGFGGGSFHSSHLASSYAAINTLAIIGTPKAFEFVDRKKLLQFLLDLKQPDGSFRMHHGGEVDIRGAYCAFAMATLFGVLTPELTAKTDDWILRCQTFEGGLSGIPGGEAHGGYTFCGLAAMHLMGKADRLNLERLLSWVVHRQMPLEGGFQGRANKLVDSCYSFWQAACFPIIHHLLDNQKSPSLHLQGSFHQSKHPLFQQDGLFTFRHFHLQEYILRCGQDSGGGLRDKPSKFPDLYHTCYALSGLSIAQHSPDLPRVLGNPDTNYVMETHPVFNVRKDIVQKTLNHFKDKPLH